MASLIALQAACQLQFNSEDSVQAIALNCVFIAYISSKLFMWCIKAIIMFSPYNIMDLKLRTCSCELMWCL